MADISAPTALQGLRARSLDDLIRWVVTVALTLFGAVILWDYGYLQYIIDNDITYISQTILVGFVAATVFVLWHLLALSRELAAVTAIAARLDAGPGALATLGRGGGTRIAACVADVLRARAADPDAAIDALTAATAAEIRGPVRLSTYMGDALYKLGMLGAVVGFIMMLASVRNLDGFDAESLRGALQEMTSGMAVSLLTTIAGLATGMLLKVQTNILDSLAMRILRGLVRITAVLIPEQTRARADRPADV